MLILLTALAAQAADVLINEVVYDPTGSDAGMEWIELCNTTGVDVDITGWIVEGGGTTYSESYTFTSGTVPAGGYLLVGYGSDTHAVSFSPNLQNGGSETDGIRLVRDDSTVEDVILYDSPNTNGLTIEDGSVGTSFAADVSEGHSLGRVPDCDDSDDSGVDFADFDAPTPGVSNDGTTDTGTSSTDTAAGDTGAGDTATSETGSTETGATETGATDTGSTDTAGTDTGDTDTGDTGDTGSESCVDAGLVINELLPAPDGTDAGHEWLELYNPTAGDIDLSGWWLEWGSSSYNHDALLSGTIAAGGWFLIGGADVADTDLVVELSMGNASDADAVRLLDCVGAVADTVIYGSPNTNEWLDDTGAIAGSLAEKPGDDESVARISDGYDTDACGVDFLVSDAPTPGAANPVIEPAVCEASTGGVVINELVYNPVGSDGGYEWVELFNAGTQTARLDSWVIETATSTWGTDYAFPGGTLLKPGAYLVIGGKGVAAADLVATGLGLGNASTGPDGVRLLDCLGSVVDTVLYGELDKKDEPDELYDDLGAQSMAAPASEGSSLGRDPNGVDTDDSLVDFGEFEFPTPGALNSNEAADCPGMDSIKINELMPNPEGTDTDAEWVELYNASSDDVELDGWVLQWGASSYSNSVDLSGTLKGGGWYVVGGPLVADVDLEADVDMGNASSSADAVRLVHCGGGVADTVIYGEDNSNDEWTDDRGEIASSLAPKPEDGKSLARVRDGYDTDLSGSDFVSGEPSIGDENPEVEPTVCVGSTGGVVINEIFPNPAGTDDDGEWIELFNASGEAVRLDAWVIETATSSWGSDFVFPGGIELASGAFMVIGGTAVPVDDLVASGLGLGNAGTGPDGVRLVDCEGNVVDTVLYGDEDEEDPDDLYDDAGEQTVVAMPDDDKSAGRYPDGTDSNDNGEDFSTNMTPTPGAANAEVTHSGSGDSELPGSKGCGGRKADSEYGGADASKCSVIGPVGGMGWIVLAFVAVRRRR